VSILLVIPEAASAKRAVEAVIADPVAARFKKSLLVIIFGVVFL